MKSKIGLLVILVSLFTLYSNVRGQETDEQTKKQSSQLKPMTLLKDGELGSIKLRSSFTLSNSKGVPLFYVGADGKIGLGTINPTERLTLDGFIHLTDGGIKFPDGTILTSARGGGGRDVMVVNLAPLQISGTHSQTFLNLQATNWSGGGQYAEIAVTHPSGSNAYTRIRSITSDPPSWSADLAFFTNPGPSSTTPAIERMRILDNGNVGIGTTGPNTKLTVWTPSATAVQEGIRINNPVGFAGNGNGSSLVFSQDRSTSENFINATIQGVQELANSSASAYLAFSTKSVGAVAEKMRITGNGNVGIGTATPQAELDVRGNVKLGSSGGTIEGRTSGNV
ncbi:MAG: hypothetical protein AAB393_13810, partial [Bacteroidota bacterium]